MWHDYVKVTILLSNINLIHMEINHPSFSATWMLFCVYGPPHERYKTTFWTNLEILISSISVP